MKVRKLQGYNNPVSKEIGLFYAFFQTATNSKIQPAIKLKPPSGVIAPSHFIPVIANTYKLPENKMIPALRKIADHFK